MGMEEWSPDTVVEHWSGGYWRIALPRLIEVPDSAIAIAAANVRITESGAVRLTESGETRIIE